MSLHDHVERLIANLRRSAETLARARDALRERRAAWLSPGAGLLRESADDLRELAERSAALEAERQEVLAELARRLPVRALPGLEPHLTVTRIAAGLQAPLAGRLRAAAAEASREARTARLETMLGRRLLEFSRTAQEGVFRDLVGLQEAKGASGYDRNARGTGEARGTTGNLIDGRV